jgi:hypothetical protein
MARINAVVKNHVLTNTPEGRKIAADAAAKKAAEKGPAATGAVPLLMDVPEEKRRARRVLLGTTGV